MRGRVWISLSVALNLLLGVLLWRQSSPEPDATPGAAPGHDVAEVQTLVRTNTVIRRQNFLWADIESPDYEVYIANLRLVGCPEDTIRDIIVADVNQVFLRRQATEIVSPHQQWWRSEIDPEVAQAAVHNAQALARERRGLLTQLLGPDWESAEYPFPSAYALSPLDGPILGRLEPATKAAVHEIERSSQERLRAYLDQVEATGDPPDPELLARLHEESRAALAQILSPEAVEEFLLRYSPLASDLRDSLRAVEVSPEEFRTLFRALDSLSHEDAQDASSSVAALTGPVTQLLQDHQDTLRRVLGEERYENLKLSRDSLYQEASRIVDQTGARQDQIVPLAAIVRLTQEELNRIRSDLSLTSEERVEQLRATREAQHSSLRSLLGEDAFQRYLDTHPQLWDPTSP